MFINTVSSEPSPAFVQINKANDGWFKPYLLTDDLLSDIRHRVMQKKDSLSHLNMNLLGFFHNLERMFNTHFPLFGSEFSSSVQMFSNNMNIANMEMSAWEYLTGRGPVGSYILEHIQMHMLLEADVAFDSVQTKYTVLEKEYGDIFNYHPDFIYRDKNGVPVSYRTEYMHGDFVKILQKKKPFIPLLKYIIQTQNEHALSILRVKDKFDVTDSGFLQKINNQTNVIKIVANIRDTKMYYDFSPLYENDKGILGYYHRPEMIWVDTTGLIIPDTAPKVIEGIDKLFQRINIRDTDELAPYIETLNVNLDDLILLLDDVHNIESEVETVKPELRTFKQALEIVTRDDKGVTIKFEKVNYHLPVKTELDEQTKKLIISYGYKDYNYSGNSSNIVGTIDLSNGKFTHPENKLLCIFVLQRLNTHIESLLVFGKQFQSEMKGEDDAQQE